MNPAIHKAVYSVLPKCPTRDILAIVKLIQRNYDQEGFRSAFYLDPKRAVIFYAVAHIRHQHTEYEALLKVEAKHHARVDIGAKIGTIMRQWGVKNYRDKPTHYPDDVVVEGVNRHAIPKLRYATKEELKIKKEQEIIKECSRYSGKFTGETNRSGIKKLLTK